jgi:hypothetical protein
MEQLPVFVIKLCLELAKGHPGRIHSQQVFVLAVHILHKHISHLDYPPYPFPTILGSHHLQNDGQELT